MQHLTFVSDVSLLQRSELELRKSGAPGRVIYDEDYKYPNKAVRGKDTGRRWCEL
jgi:hypothetical protein